MQVYGSKEIIFQGLFDPTQISLLWLIIFLAFMVMQLFPNIPLNWMTLRTLSKIADRLRVLNEFDMRGRKALAEQLKKYGGNVEKMNEYVQEIVEYFDIGPVERDPYGILNRLEYMLDLSRYRFRSLLKNYAPNADEESLSTLENTAAVANVLHLINKIGRHYYNLAKKFKNFYIAQQIEFIMPMLIDLAKNYYKALPATTQQIPIGDAIGPMVIANMFKKYGVKEVVDVGNEMIMGEALFENRKLLLLKAKGPAGRVGKPGAAVRQIVESHKDLIKVIITIDAASKLEGEETGSIAQGIGAAIGDPGPEKFKIEEAALTYRIPLIAIIIKQGFNEAISPMLKQIATKVDEVIDRVEKLVREMVPEGGIALIVGIGNTLGVGNGA
ncbi:MAG: DUF1512 domain-containing protein [Thermoproteota archaeon]|jgi:hypothetical protein|nr:DUF1512 domain-containing protein [Thermoproteota archaeon]